ncbi:MAG: pantoate--beta-alanine ligase [Sphingobacteriales bacterium]|jgi:pantoate--beta-alanine ligase
MKVINSSEQLNEEISALKKNGQTVGFVPTMGALHSGHLSLLEEAGKQCDIVVISIFVNPTQFNDISDFSKYPRTLDADVNLLTDVKCDIVFAPELKVIYPEQSDFKHTFGELENKLEGSHRPGHFNGVGQVLHRLFSIVKPDKAFFGLKDYQQFLIINRLVEDFAFPIEIIGCETRRDENGLALSSRNTRLSELDYNNALMLNQTLRAVRAAYQEGAGPEAILQMAEFQIKSNPAISLEYFEICDGKNLNALIAFNPEATPIALVAAKVGDVRLIDNMFLNV